MVKINRKGNRGGKMKDIIIANGMDKKHKWPKCSNLPKFAHEIPKFVNVYKKRLWDAIFAEKERELK